jgi:hypothetical protein
MLPLRATAEMTIFALNGMMSVSYPAMYRTVNSPVGLVEWNDREGALRAGEICEPCQPIDCGQLCYSESQSAISKSMRGVLTRQAETSLRREKDDMLGSESNSG